MLLAGVQLHPHGGALHLLPVVVPPSLPPCQVCLPAVVPCSWGQEWCSSGLWGAAQASGYAVSVDIIYSGYFKTVNSECQSPTVVLRWGWWYANMF